MTTDQIIAALFDAAQKKGLSQAEVARRMYFNPNTLTCWKKRKSTPTIFEMIEFAEIVGLEITVVRKGEANDKGADNSSAV